MLPVGDLAQRGPPDEVDGRVKDLAEHAVVKGHRGAQGALIHLCK
jgi:hypothetical protein